MNHGYHSRRKIFLLYEFLQTEPGTRIDRHRDKVGLDENSHHVKPPHVQEFVHRRTGSVACHPLEGEGGRHLIAA
jgi:hypothetical protein